MALMLAPYNSAMRLGMGFNSYTQTLCVNDVVRKPGNVPASDQDLRAGQLTQKTDAGTMESGRLTTSSRQLTPDGVLQGANGSMVRTIVDGQKEVSQVVTWEASFIENSSDVLEKLDVSGALEIKMAGLGGLKGHAGFVDSSEIKKADINYLVHVKVVNQRLVADNVTQFSPIDYIDEGQFTDIYGDCFISGFIEGGEFNAIISITSADTLAKNHIGGGLEIAAEFSGVEVKGQASGNKDKNSHLKGAQTKISVAWSGGGDIRPDTVEEWTLESLKKVAMSFPDAVAACPQRISAILTKYTSLRSYHEASKKGSPLDYENAGVYTASLYDAYTDYKFMWKEIQLMISGLNKKQIELRSYDLPEGLQKYAKKYLAAQERKNKMQKNAIEAQNKTDNMDMLALVPKQDKVPAPIEEPPEAKTLELYNPDVFGLELAAADCRFEMIKIVREVDAVTRDPKVACDPSRTYQYLSPSVFKLLLPTPEKEELPTMAQWKLAKEDQAQKDQYVKDRNNEISRLKKKLEEALITPIPDERGSLLANAAKDNAELHEDIRKSVSALVYRAGDYRMQSLLDKSGISTGAAFFNDLESLEHNERPTELRFWNDEGKIKGIYVKYSAGNEISHGQMKGNPKDVLQLESDEVITEVEVHTVKGADDKLSVTAIAVATSKCNVLTVGNKIAGVTHKYSMADYRQWSFRGFFGFTFVDSFEGLGIVWGKEVSTAATATVQMPPAKNLLGMGPSLQKKTRKAMSETKPTEHFYMGDCVSTGPSSSTANSFSALDVLAGSDKIRKITFSVSGGRLSGLKVDYGNDKQTTHGTYTEGPETWSCEVKGPIVAAQLTVGKTISKPDPFVNSVELVCGDENGELPLWPLDISTIRYLGNHREDDGLDIVSKLTEQAPKLARANWTLRGFYGEESQGLITRLGLIWGCA